MHYHGAMRTPATGTRADTAPAAGGEPDTRTRLLRAALRLFRQHGYHGVGVNEILAQAEAPKGSLYHHFPGGKEEIGAAVVALIRDSLLAVIDAQPATLPAERVVERVGGQLLETVSRTRHELCALFAAFSAERSNAPRLAEAVSEAYAAFSARVESRLTADGWSAREARERAALVVMLFEGGSLLAAARQDLEAFRLAIREARRACAAPAPSAPSAVPGASAASTTGRAQRAKAAPSARSRARASGG